MKERVYIAIDLKSFYASVECVERGLDPLNTNLVVADASRTQKTICLAASPSLKQFNIPGRARLFEVIQKVKDENKKRVKFSKNYRFTGSSTFNDELKSSPDLAIDFITATPRMALYTTYSTRVYAVYLNHVAPEDIHVYSIDEVFIDATNYLKSNRLSPYEFAKLIIKDVFDTVGITATAGIGTNLYLCKIAMDIMAKHIPPDKDGVRIAELDEISYRELLWSHRPITDFWRVGKGYAKKLEDYQMFTMGDIARCSVGDSKTYRNENLLYELFGVNAELLIDHAWGYEPCTLADIKSYKPENKSLGSGQVLHEPYSFDKARIVAQEMIDLLVLDLVDKELLTDQIVLTVGYDIENLKNAKIRTKYHGEIKVDYYGREVPKHSHGTVNLKSLTSSTMIIVEAVMKLFDKIVNPILLVRRINVSVNHVVSENESKQSVVNAQQDLFADLEDEEVNEDDKLALEKEKTIQNTILTLKNKFGKNVILKGSNLQEGATTKERNDQIGGHKA